MILPDVDTIRKRFLSIQLVEVAGSLCYAYIDFLCYDKSQYEDDLYFHSHYAIIFIFAFRIFF